MSAKQVVNLFTAILTPDAEGFWDVMFPELPGLHTFGRSVREARRMASDAVREWLKQHEKLGIRIKIRRMK